MYLSVEDSYYEAGVSGGVYVPVPTASVIQLVSDDGEILATAYRHESGRFTVTDDVQGDTLLYRDWQTCLAVQATGIDRAGLEETFSEGWA